MIEAAAGNLTYHIDTPIPRDGDDGVERTEIDTWGAHGSQHFIFPATMVNRKILTDDTHVGRKVRGTSKTGYFVNKSIEERK
jgi:hypothetical protein